MPFQSKFYITNNFLFRVVRKIIQESYMLMVYSQRSTLESLCVVVYTSKHMEFAITLLIFKQFGISFALQKWS